MATDLKSIEQNVRQNTDLEQSAVTLVNGLADALDGLSNDPVAIKTLAGDLRKSAAPLGKAVVDNTQQSRSGGAAPGTQPSNPSAPQSTAQPATQPGQAPPQTSKAAPGQNPQAGKTK